MPGSFITAIIFVVLAALAGIVWLVASRAVKRNGRSESAESDSSRGPSRGFSSHNDGLADDARMTANIAKYVTVAFLALAGFMTFYASATLVSTKNVGIVTSFGRPVGEPLANGFHFVAPWQKVTEMDGAIQTDSHVGDAEGNDGTCTTIRIANQSTSCVDNSIRWRIQPGAADTLFRDYKEFENVRDSLVTRGLTAALNTVFASYDPLGTISQEGTSTAPSLDQLQDKVKAQLQSQIGGQIEILEVIIPLVRYDGPTQDKINAFQAELANTRIAKQKELTAINEAAANKALADSVSKDPNVLVSKCMDTQNAAVKAGQSIQGAPSCWPGGGTTGVLVQTK